MQTEQTELIAFTREELDLVSTELPGYNHNLYVIALLIFNCFLRPHEIVRLQVRFFKNIGDCLSIPGSVSKNKKNETISIPGQLRQEIQKMNLDCPGDWYIFGLHIDRNPKQVPPTRIAEAWKQFSNL